MAGVFLLSLIPLYLLAFYAHPSVDDYYYGAETARLWREGGGLGGVLGLARDMMAESYQSWQGNFAAIFLMRLQPGIFGEDAYAAAPLILITTFVSAMLFFYYTALRRLVGAGRPAAWGISLAISFCALQFCYKPADAFYWYNGGIYYCFFFSLSYCLLGLLILANKARKKGARISAVLGAALLALLIGGSNYSTALSLAVLLVSLLGLCLILGRLPGCQPSESGAARPGRLSFLLLLLVFGCLLVSLMISILAPGNAIRQAAAGESSGVIKALAYSFAYGGYSLTEGLKLPVVLLWLGLLPLFYHLSRRLPGQYPRPLLVLLYTFGIYASQGTALFYAQGLRMPPRMSNIIYFNAYLFVAFNLFYLCGWLRRRYPGNLLERLTEGLIQDGKRLLRFALLMGLAFSLACLGLWQVSEKEEGGAAFEVQPLSVSAAYSLLIGEAAQYDRDMKARHEYLSVQPEGAAVAVPPLRAYPPALTHSEITEDPDDFKNQHLAIYYHLDSVVLKEE